MDVLTAFLVVLVGMTTVATLESRARKLDRRMVRLEQKIGLLLEEANVPDHELVPAEVAALARAGEDISAIKKYREATGAGLLEAKEVVDRLKG
jgi:ribosomal protein L7/L12